MEKVNITVEFCTFELVQVPNFSLNFNFDFFLTEFAEKGNLRSKNEKIALVRTSVIVTYYIKIFRTRADKRNGNLMSLLLLVAETKILKMNERKEKQPHKRYYTQHCKL